MAGMFALSADAVEVAAVVVCDSDLISGAICYQAAR